MQFVHVSKDASPQKAQGGFVTASLAALLVARASCSSARFFFFKAASSCSFLRIGSSLQGILCFGQCLT